ncbi:MAG: hypothetical protein KGR99_17805 [Betaproteobacteria bacterium]|nr:hypothetical protein [Betaproteobacteria bacterium]
MARQVGTKLLRLIRERSYLSGELPILEKAVSDRSAELQAAREGLEVARAKIAELDAQIVALVPGIDPNDVHPRRRTPRRQSAPHGAFVDTLVEVLQEAGAAGINAKELGAQLWLVFPMDQSTADCRRKARRKIGKALRGLAARGAVEQIGQDTDPTTGQSIGRWRWVTA